MWSCVEWQAGRQVGGLGAPRVPAAGRQTGQGQIASISERADHRRRSRQTDGPTELPSWSLLIDTCNWHQSRDSNTVVAARRELSTAQNDRGTSVHARTTKRPRLESERQIATNEDLSSSFRVLPYRRVVSLDGSDELLGQKPNPLLPHYISLGGMYTGGGTLRDSLPLYLIEAVGFAPPPPTSSPDDCDGRIVCRKTCDPPESEPGADCAMPPRVSLAGGSSLSISSGHRVFRRPG